MNESLICECGNQNFWYFWTYVRCTKCFNEYKYEFYEDDEHFGGFGGIENQSGPQYWMRRFDKSKNQYDNWGKSKLTYKK